MGGAVAFLGESRLEGLGPAREIHPGHDAAHLVDAVGLGGPEDRV